MPIARRFHATGLPDPRHRGHRALPPRAAGSRPSGCSRCTRAGPTRSTSCVSGQIQLLINTPLGKLTQQDDYAIRRAALQHRVPYTTTLSAASAACDAIIALRSRVGDGALAPGVARARAGDVAGMDRLTARDTGLRRRRSERGSGERCGRREPLARYSTYRIGGPATVLLPAVPEDVGDGAPAGARGGIPWFALGLGSNILLPDEGLDALVIRLGKGLDQPAPGRRALDRRRRPAGAARGAADGRGGLRRTAHLGGRAGHGRWRRVHERRLPRRRLVGGRRVGDRGRTRRDATRCSPRAAIPFTYRRSGLEGRIVLETTVRLRRRGAAPAGRGDRRAVRLAPGGNAVQPALLRQRVQEPVGAELESGRRAADRGAADRGGGAQGVTEWAARRSRRCTPTTSSTPARRPPPTSAALIELRAAGGRCSGSGARSSRR